MFEFFRRTKLKDIKDLVVLTDSIDYIKESYPFLTRTPAPEFKGVFLIETFYLDSIYSRRTLKKEYFQSSYEQVKEVFQEYVESLKGKIRILSERDRGIRVEVFFVNVLKDNTLVSQPYCLLESYIEF